MDGNDRQAYDRGTSLYSPDGRIYQVEYAREAVSRGEPAAAVRTADRVVFAGVVKQQSPLQVTESVDKLHRVSDHVGAATAGHAADGRQLVDFARRTAQQEQLRYGQPATVETIVTALGDHVQEYTQSGGTRPFGAALLVGGVVDGGPELYAIGPEGVPTTWHAAAVGAGAEPIREYVHETCETDEIEDLDEDDAVDLLVDALCEADDDLDADNVVVGVGDEDGYRMHGDHADADDAE